MEAWGLRVDWVDGDALRVVRLRVEGTEADAAAARSKLGVYNLNNHIHHALTISGVRFCVEGQDSKAKREKNPPPHLPLA